MSANILTSIEEMFDSSPALDRQSTFNQLWALTSELFARVKQHFELQRDPSCDDLMPYKGLDGAAGYLANYSGPQVDWLTHSWTGNPKASFTNMHLTIGLGPYTDAPHFGFALGTTPDLFVYMDYLPRSDLATRPDYADKYYDKANQAYLGMQANSAFRPFISRDFYTRSTLSPASLCYGAAVNEANMATLRKVAHTHLDNWFELLDSANPLSGAERATVAERDLLIRRTITERDPANIVVEKLFGAKLGKRLVGQLWGAGRTLPRPL